MTTITKDQIHLIEGEIYVTQKRRVKMGEMYIDTEGNKISRCDHKWLGIFEGIYPIVYSTASLEGVTKLDRIVFVKPVNVSDLANIFVSSQPDYDPYNGAENCARVLGFKAGYNANKGEFSRDEMEESLVFMYHNARNTDAGESKIKEMIYNRLRPLSIPESININNNEVTVNWE